METATLRHPFRPALGLTLRLLVGAIVFIAILLYPLPVNHPRLVRDRGHLGEGLYQSTLTSAHFGLLGVNFYETDNGHKRWNIVSKFAEHHRKENYAFLDTVDAEFFASHTGNIVYAQSRYGRVAMDKNRVDLEGDVSIRSKRGYLFEMDRLTYLGDKHVFETVEPVSMKGPNVKQPAMALQGIGLWANIDDEHFVVHNHVTAVRRLKSGEAIRIQSKSGEFFTHTQESIFRNNVHATLPKIVLESDLLELEMSDEAESILASGHVKLDSKKRMGHADRARIEINGNHIVLEGRASVDTKGNRIEGHRITLYTDDDRIEVDQAQGSLEP